MNDLLRDDLRRLSDMLLPGVAPYWIFADELPESAAVPVRGWCLGFYNPEFDLVVRDSLLSAGQWRGRAPAIVLDGEATRQSVDGLTYYSPALESLALHGRLLVTAIHEIGHVVEMPQASIAETEIPQPALHAEFSREFVARSARVAEPEHSDWHQHGPVWLRAVAHGNYRARKAGFELPPDGGQNHLPTICSTNMSLRDEFETLEHVPLSELAQHRPPADYASTWRFSVNKWLSRQDDPDDIFAKARARVLLKYFDP